MTYLKQKIAKEFPDDFWEDTQSKLTFIQATTVPKHILSTAVKCIILRHGKILLTKVPRGWDIPTGHIENRETALQAVIREVFEETGVTVLTCHLLGYLHLEKFKKNEKNKKYPKISAIPIYIGDKFIVRRSFKKLYEATDRKFFKLSADGSIQSQNWSLLMNKIFLCALSENNKKNT